MYPVITWWQRWKERQGKALDLSRVDLKRVREDLITRPNNMLQSIFLGVQDAKDTVWV